MHKATPNLENIAVSDCGSSGMCLAFAAAICCSHISLALALASMCLQPSDHFRSENCHASTFSTHTLSQSLGTYSTTRRRHGFPDLGWLTSLVRHKGPVFGCGRCTCNARACQGDIISRKVCLRPPSRSNCGGIPWACKGPFPNVIFPWLTTSIMMPTHQMHPCAPKAPNVPPCTHDIYTWKNGRCTRTDTFAAITITFATLKNPHFIWLHGESHKRHFGG